jgi:hypothetical protein
MGFYFATDEGEDQKPTDQEAEVRHRGSPKGGNTIEITSDWLHPPPMLSSSSSISTSSSNPRCNLLANMMFDAIYYS